MPRRDIEFKTSDQVTLRGWLYTPTASGEDKLPCLIMAHGFSAIKEMDLDLFAEHFVSHLPMTCLVYDNRCFGASDGEPRQEIDPWKQMSDYSMPSLMRSRCPKWKRRGSAFGEARTVAAMFCGPLVSGWENLNRLVRPDLVPGFLKMYQDDRLARAQGKEPTKVPVVEADPTKPSALPTSDSYTFFAEWQKKVSWINEVTLKSLEMLRAHEPWAHVHHISPTPLLMTVAENDVLTPTDISIEAFARAREPKQLHIIPGGHFDGYSGPNFERNAGRQVEFIRSTLCS